MMQKEIKCIVWDLDNTLWDNTFLETNDVRLKSGIKDIVKTLDTRGVIHSIASKNDHQDVMKKLKEYGIDEYFIYPEINWNAKSVSLERISKSINIGMDSILFIDDQAFERDEVKKAHPEVTCLDAKEYSTLLSLPRLQPRFITADSKRRRLMYIEETKRRKKEEEFLGTPEAFLASLELHFTISEAKEEDLKRAEELTVRTHQLNATGTTYNYDELNAFRLSKTHKLYVCELRDIYGSYGKIGLALVEIKKSHWHLLLLLMSCRVMSRGVGTVLLSYVMKETKKAGKKLLADFKKIGDRNRMMYVTYRFANFKEISKDEDGRIILENDLSTIQDYPPYIKVETFCSGKEYHGREKNN